MERTVKAFARLPGIGERTATRFTHFLLRDEQGLAQELAKTLVELKQQVHFCRLCQNLTETECCAICRDSHRQTTTICVVEEVADLLAIEKTGEYHGLYHVLHGSIAPLDGVGPDQIRIKGLLDRLREGKVEEVILATNPNPTGEMTALYLKKLLGPLGIATVSRIASGIPVGGNVEHTDAQTLSRAMESRREY